MEKKLHRDEHRKVVGGVCAGLAEYFDIDVSIVRLVFLLSLLLKGGGGLIYIVLWIVLPKRGYLPPVDYTVPPGGAPYQAPGTYVSASPFHPNPAFVPRKGPSTGALIGGIILIMLGGGFLLDQFEIIPDFDFENWWPVILIVIGLVFIFTSGSKDRSGPKPWQTPVHEVKTDEVTENPTDNPPTAI